MFIQNGWDKTYNLGLTCTQKSSYITHKGDKVLVLESAFSDPEPGRWRLHGDVVDQMLDNSMGEKSYE